MQVKYRSQAKQASIPHLRAEGISHISRPAGYFEVAADSLISGALQLALAPVIRPAQRAARLRGPYPRAGVEILPPSGRMPEINLGLINSPAPPAFTQWRIHPLESSTGTYAFSVASFNLCREHVAAGPRYLRIVRSPFQRGRSIHQCARSFSTTRRYEVGPTLGVRLPAGLAVEGDACFAARRQTSRVVHCERQRAFRLPGSFR